MQALKKELGLLVPSLKVFLVSGIGRDANVKLTLFVAQDVENLTSIADLEALIGNSEVVLIFLSAGYFSRWNCLREARETLVAKKDLILMREVAVMHGTIRHVELQVLKNCINTCNTVCR
jgi:hypothetical protein